MRVSSFNGGPLPALLFEHLHLLNSSSCCFCVAGLAVKPCELIVQAPVRIRLYAESKLIDGLLRLPGIGIDLTKQSVDVRKHLWLCTQGLLQIRFSRSKLVPRDKHLSHK